MYEGEGFRNDNEKTIYIVFLFNTTSLYKNKPNTYSDTTIGTRVAGVAENVSLFVSQRKKKGTLSLGCRMC